MGHSSVEPSSPLGVSQSISHHPHQSAQQQARRADSPTVPVPLTTTPDEQRGPVREGAPQPNGFAGEYFNQRCSSANSGAYSRGGGRSQRRPHSAGSHGQTPLPSSPEHLGAATDDCADDELADNEYTLLISGGAASANLMDPPTNRFGGGESAKNGGFLLKVLASVGVAKRQLPSGVPSPATASSHLADEATSGAPRVLTNHQSRTAFLPWAALAKAWKGCVGADGGRETEMSASPSRLTRRLVPTSLLCMLLLLLPSLVIIIHILAPFEHGHSLSLHYWPDLDGVGDAFSGLDIDQGQLEAGQSLRWLVAQQKCSIPAIDPWHSSISDYVYRKEPLLCSKFMAESKRSPKQALTYVRDNKIFFSDRALEWGAPMKCCSRPISRVVDSDDELQYNDTCYPMNGHAYTPPFDLMRVECQAFNYTSVHSFILHHSEEERLQRQLAERRLNQTHQYNILMLGVDTMSRLNGHRQLNKTLQLLRNNYETLEFFGYNKVGENTFPNLVPLLTGLTPEQLTETECWLAKNYSKDNEKGDDYLDNCKFMWNYYQEVGYITYYSEDWPKASTFNYLKPGFKREPTAFYGRPFTLARDSMTLPEVEMGCASCLLDEPMVGVDLERLKSFLTMYQSTANFAFQWINCPQHDDLNGASQFDDLMLQFFKDIHSITNQQRTFVIFFSDHGYRWNNFVSTRVGHYESSLPLMTIAAPRHFIENHPDLYANLKRHQAALLTPFDVFKTLVHLRNISLIEQAVAEPLKLRQLVSRANATNATASPRTAVDDFETAGPTASTTVEQLVPTTGLNYKQNFTTFSLLDNHGSTELDRSCIDAGIPDNYCVCHEFESADLSSNDVIGAALFYVHNFLHKRLADDKNRCRELDLDTIVKAEIFDFKRMKTRGANKRRKRSSPATKRAHQMPNREYNVMLSTKPGGALFQEVIRFYGQDVEECKKAVEEAKRKIDHETNDFKAKHKAVRTMNKVCQFSVHSESISRLNLYKKQSGCVKRNIELKKICLCHDVPLP